MTDKQFICQQLTAEFTKNYTKKIFYFCLKKTGCHWEAEDLLQDICLNVLTSLRNGAQPEYFSAWVWQIARNRYAVWAENKHLRAGSETGIDFDDGEISDQNETPEEQMLHCEQLSLLRRELAFIRNDYRNIIVAYYIEDRSVHEIAESFSLTENTVKQRLHRARQELKEGMNMAREFGVLSYKPENIAFFMNGLQGSAGEPWNDLSRLLCKNILLAAYRTPATAKELAIEVGVALPYMEEELESLVAATLMKKSGSRHDRYEPRYETNFFIVSSRAQQKIYEHLRSVAPDLTQTIIDALEFETAWKNKACPGWHDGYQPYEDMKWALLMQKVDAIESDLQNELQKNTGSFSNLGSWGHTIRPNGGEWDVLGLEIYSGEKPPFVGLHGCVASPSERELPEIEFRQYKYYYKKIEQQTPVTLHYSEGQALARLAKGEKNTGDTELLQALEKVGYIRKNGQGWVPSILVMRRDRQPEMPEAEQKQLQLLYKKAKECMTRHHLFCREQISGEIPEFLKEDEFQICHGYRNIAMFRGAVLEEALRLGYLYYHRDDPKRMLGAYIVV